MRRLVLFALVLPVVFGLATSAAQARHAGTTLNLVAYSTPKPVMQKLITRFEYNALGTRYRARGALTLASGRHELSARFDRDGRGGTLTVACRTFTGAWAASAISPPIRWATSTPPN